VPLAIAVWQWRYTVRVTDRLLTISTFTTRTVPLLDISEENTPMTKQRKSKSVFIDSAAKTPFFPARPLQYASTLRML